MQLVEVGEQANARMTCPSCGFTEGTPAEQAFMLNPGTMLSGRYLIGTSLGFGGFGVTYRAWDNELDTLVAIKEYYPSGLVQRTPGEKEVILAAGNRKDEFEQGLNRFLDEARNMAKFTSPNIVGVSNYFEENHTGYIVMEFLSGISLKDYLKMEGGRLDCETSVLIISEVIKGLSVVHKAGILHRDISPDNIFICEGNRVKLIDFGAARFSDEEKEVTRSIILKPGFAPPEQYRQKSKQGPFTDIYALSATLYRMLTGKLPVDSTNRLDKDTLQSPRELNPEIPEYLSNAIMKGMALDSELRFRNVEEMAAAISGKTQVRGVAEEVKSRKKKRGLFVVAAILLILAGLGVAGGLYLKSYNKTHLKAAKVTVWASYGNGESEDNTKTRVSDMLSDFKKEYSNIEITIECFPEKDYAEKLDEAQKNGNMPVLFMSDSASDAVLADCIDLSEVYEYLTLSDYYFLSDYKQSGNITQIPTAFNVPVIFARRNDGFDINSLKFDDTYMLFGSYSNGTYFLSDAYAMIVNSTGGSFRINGDAEIDKTGSTLIDSYYVHSAGGYKTDEEALAAFVKGDLTFYLATVKQYDLFSKSAPGLFAMHSFNFDSINGDYAELFSISKSASKDEAAAAKMMLAYILGNEAQKKGHSSAGCSLPLSKAAFSELLELNDSFNEIKDYLTKLVFYPKEQRDLKEKSREMADRFFNK